MNLVNFTIEIEVTQEEAEGGLRAALGMEIEGDMGSEGEE